VYRHRRANSRRGVPIAAALAQIRLAAMTSAAVTPSSGVARRREAAMPTAARETAGPAAKAGMAKAATRETATPVVTETAVEAEPANTERDIGSVIIRVTV
jgi:hypothetical protein